MFRYFKTFSRLLPTVKATHLYAPGHRFNKLVSLSTSPKRITHFRKDTPSPTKSPPSNAEIDNLKKLFSEADKDKDGFLNEEETRQVLKKTSPWLIDRLIGYAFENTNTITKCGLNDILRAYEYLDFMKKSSDGMCDKAFEALGVKPDGKASIKDVAKYYNKLDPSDEEEELSKSMKPYDKDEDGSLTLAELRDWNLYKYTSFSCHDLNK